MLGATTPAPGTRRIAAACLAVGLGVAMGARLAAPVSVPLDDGVSLEEPYRYLAPGPGEASSPSSFSSDFPVTAGLSPGFAAGTSESPPQVQLIAPDGAFTLGSGTTAVHVSIEPVPAAQAPTSGSIAGNAYQVTVSDQSGITLEVAPGTLPTLVLRAPTGIADAKIARLTTAGWQPGDTQPSGSSLFTTEPAALGDFALIVSSGFDPLALVGAILVTGLPLAALLVFLLRRRRARRAATEVATTRRRIPSKRTPQRPSSTRRRP